MYIIKATFCSWGGITNPLYPFSIQTHDFSWLSRVGKYVYEDNFFSLHGRNMRTNVGSI